MNGHTSLSSSRWHLHGSRRSTLFPIRLLFAGLTLVSIQMIANIVIYLRIDVPEKDPAFISAVAELQEQIRELQELVPSFPKPYTEDDTFYPFTIRDSKRLTPIQVPAGFHIYDYLDTTTGNQRTSRKMQLWLDAHYLRPATCHRYAVTCYKQKILEVFDYLLANTTATYFFYMESDNELCVPLDYIRDLTYRHRRYFIGTGIGFSGWIMNRTFMEDFVEAYRPPHVNNNENPDPIGARLLMEKKAWAVTRQYLVSHTIKQSLGAPPLTVGKKDVKTGQVKEVKHLPRCFEPKRTKWLETNTSTEDMHGWDFFDSPDCPPDAEIYPCRADQYVNVTYGVKDMIKKNKTALLRNNKTALLRNNKTALLRNNMTDLGLKRITGLLAKKSHGHAISSSKASFIRGLFNNLFAT